MDSEVGSLSADLNSLPKVLRQIILQIEHLIDVEIPDRTQTHPPRLQQRASNIVVMWNIFSDQRRTLDSLLQKISLTIDDSLSRIKGEIIKLEVGSGTITDTGIQEFEIIEGKVWNVYLYNPEDFLYIRLLHETRLQRQEDWLSVDIDHIRNSAWFMD
ncbi:MAG: hypothetical protein ACFFFG_10355 [Candidatus Thorarchaeota archaeon]